MQLGRRFKLWKFEVAATALQSGPEKRDGALHVPSCWWKCARQDTGFEQARRSPVKDDACLNWDCLGGCLLVGWLHAIVSEVSEIALATERNQKIDEAYQRDWPPKQHFQANEPGKTVVYDSLEVQMGSKVSSA